LEDFSTEVHHIKIKAIIHDDLLDIPKEEFFYRQPFVGFGKIFFPRKDGYLTIIDSSFNIKEINLGQPLFSVYGLEDKKHIIVGGYDKIFGLNEVGELLWEFETHGEVYAINYLNNSLYISSEDNYLYCLNYDGMLNWKFHARGIISSRAEILLYNQNYKIIFGSYDQRLYILNLDGSLFRQFELSAPIVGNLLKLNDKIIVPKKTAGNNIVIYERDKVAELNFGTPVTSKPLEFNNWIIFGGHDGFLYLFNLSNPDKQKKIKLDSKVLINPFITKDLLFVLSNKINIFKFE